VTFRVPNEARLRTGPMATNSHAGNNGAFILKCKQTVLRCIASDGEGWEHVSVSPAKPGACPSWEEMCYVKDAFWSAEDVVVQFHPAKSEYVNCHPYCLHLWRKVGEDCETPPSILIGA
jgi:hypothetical protein